MSEGSSQLSERAEPVGVRHCSGYNYIDFDLSYDTLRNPHLLAIDLSWNLEGFWLILVPEMLNQLVDVVCYLGLCVIHPVPNVSQVSLDYELLVFFGLVQDPRSLHLLKLLIG